MLANVMTQAGNDALISSPSKKDLEDKDISKENHSPTPRDIEFAVGNKKTCSITSAHASDKAIEIPKERAASQDGHISENPEQRSIFQPSRVTSPATFEATSSPDQKHQKPAFGCVSTTWPCSGCCAIVY